MAKICYFEVFCLENRRKTKLLCKERRGEGGENFFIATRKKLMVCFGPK